MVEKGFKKAKEEQLESGKKVKSKNKVHNDLVFVFLGWVENNFFFRCYFMPSRLCVFFLIHLSHSFISRVRVE